MKFEEAQKFEQNLNLVKIKEDQKKPKGTDAEEDDVEIRKKESPKNEGKIYEKEIDIPIQELEKLIKQNDNMQTIEEYFEQEGGSKATHGLEKKEDETEINPNKLSKNDKYKNNKINVPDVQ